MSMIQVETITLKDGSRMDVIRDIEKVDRLISITTKAMDSIRDFPCGHKPNGVGGTCKACEALSQWDSL